METKNEHEVRINMQNSRKIKPFYENFSNCIIWTTIPIISWIIPIIGHVGICTSSGVSHDFAGSYKIRTGRLTFGDPHKFVKLNIAENNIFDNAILQTDEIFKHKLHSLCWYFLISLKVSNNCHNHVANVLNIIKYGGYENYNMVSIWWMMLTKSKYVSCGKIIRTYLPFFIIVSLIIFIIIISKYY